MSTWEVSKRRTRPSWSAVYIYWFVQKQCCIEGCGCDWQDPVSCSIHMWCWYSPVFRIHISRRYIRPTECWIRQGKPRGRLFAMYTDASSIVTTEVCHRITRTFLAGFYSHYQRITVRLRRQPQWERPWRSSRQDVGLDQSMVYIISVITDASIIKAT
jgi:hypothetical protein